MNGNESLDSTVNSLAGTLHSAKEFVQDHPVPMAAAAAAGGSFLLTAGLHKLIDRKFPRFSRGLLPRIESVLIKAAAPLTLGYALFNPSDASEAINTYPVETAAIASGVFGSLGAMYRHIQQTKIPTRSTNRYRRR